MFTNLQDTNINIHSWLLKENRQCVFGKEGMRKGIAFYKGKRK